MALLLPKPQKRVKPPRGRHARASRSPREAIGRSLRRQRVPKRSKRPRKASRADAWKLMSLYIRSRKRCEIATKCGGREFEIGQLQACHGFGKKAYPATYFEIENLFAGCPADHSFYSWRPIQWDMWMRNHMGENKYNLVRAKALSNERVDIPTLIAWLERQPEVIAALKAKESS